MDIVTDVSILEKPMVSLSKQRDIMMLEDDHEDDFVILLRHMNHLLSWQT